jgi:hypothetical protein
VCADVIPVDDLEKGFHVVGAAVLIFEVIGVLPDVYGKDRGVTGG